MKPENKWWVKFTDSYFLYLVLLWAALFTIILFYDRLVSIPFTRWSVLWVFSQKFIPSLTIILLVTLPIFSAYVLAKWATDGTEWTKKGGTMGKGSFKVNYTLERLGDNDLGKAHGNTLIIEDGFATLDTFSFNASNIRWLGTRRYIVLDLEIDGWWWKLEIEEMDNEPLIEALIELCPDDISGARYRRRPEFRATTYHKKVFVSEQNLQGIWEKHESVQLVITPLWFLAFHEGSILQEVQIDSISEIRCIKHPTALDDAALLLTFEADESFYSYEIYDEKFVTRLTDATHEAIDNAPLRKKKAQGE